ncbi:MAG: alpha-glucosidase C-terminal domain-containing protein [Ignavibacterium sp.]|jgi:glycosidase|uniref:alpha-amylase family glycosyl hydrolase n=1 Tax=Ignavibacterium sp. TaxID=2651167 RepID=UPI0032984A6D
MLTFRKVFILFISVSTFIFSQTKTPHWAFDKTIYEVNLRQFSEEGNFDGFRKHLPRLKELGVGILWFMPIHPIGELNRKGSLGSYYSVKDYLDVNPEFGTIDDFKELVKEIHSLGMYVIIDWVANHTAWDHQWTKTHPEFYNKDDKGNFIPPVDDWSDVIDLNYNNKALWSEMINALKFWVSECDIDGYRSDVAGMVPIEFWIAARKELEKIKPVFMLAEWDTPEMHSAFDMTYDWNMHKIMNEVAKGKKSVDEIINHIQKDQENYPAYAFRMQFTDNHDENSWNGTVFERLGDAAECFAVLTFLIPDMPLIYSGQEAGLNKRLSFFEKDPIDWKEHKFFALYKSLIELKKSNELLHCGIKGGRIEFIPNNNQKNILALARVKEDKILFAVFNLSETPSEVFLNDKRLSGTFTNFFTKENFNLDQSFKIKLDAWSWQVFTK